MSALQVQATPPWEPSQYRLQSDILEAQRSTIRPEQWQTEMLTLSWDRRWEIQVLPPSNSCMCAFRHGGYTICFFGPSLRVRTGGLVPPRWTCWRMRNSDACVSHWHFHLLGVDFTCTPSWPQSHKWEAWRDNLTALCDCVSDVRHRLDGPLMTTREKRGIFCTPDGRNSLHSVLARSNTSCPGAPMTWSLDTLTGWIHSSSPETQAFSTWHHQGVKIFPSFKCLEMRRPEFGHGPRKENPTTLSMGLCFGTKLGFISI